MYAFFERQLEKIKANFQSTISPIPLKANLMGRYSLRPPREVLNISLEKVSNELYQAKLNPSLDVEQLAKLLSEALSRGKRLSRYKRELSPLAQGKSIELVKLLPRFVRQHNNKYAATAGPNCWNATLSWHDATVGTKYTKAHELILALENNYETIALSELRLGDVVALWGDPEDLIVHTATFIGNGVLWHKGGHGCHRPWTFVSFDEMVKDYLEHGAKEITFHRFVGKRKKVVGGSYEELMLELGKTYDTPLVQEGVLVRSSSSLTTLHK